MKYFLFDTETTDLIHNTQLDIERQPMIIEFYGMLIDEHGTLYRELDFLCNPGIPIKDEVVKITGIDQDMVKNEKPFSHYANDVISIIESSDAIIAHNLAYDFFIVYTELKRLGLSAQWPQRKICTVEQTEWISGYRLSLSNLYEKLFDKKFLNAHRAKNDVEALKEIFLKLLNDGLI